MFDRLGQRLLQESSFEIDDKPVLYKKLIDQPQLIADWQQIEQCVNSPQFFDFELVNDQSQKIIIPAHAKTWIYDKKIYDKKFIVDAFNAGNTLVITNYGFKNNVINELLNRFEKLFDVYASAMLYCGKTQAHSFSIHDDYPANFVLQIEGQTRWKVFENKISYLYKTGRMNNLVNENDLRVAIDVLLEPGDMLYIPARTFHCAYPSSQRISISIPCWNKLTTDSYFANIDRNYYKLEL